MRLSRKVLDAYNAAIKKQGDNAENAARMAIEAWLEENPGATVAETREFSIALMNEVGALYGNAAGDVAYALRDMVAEAAGVELEPVDYEYAPDAEYVGRAAHYQAGKLAEGDARGFVDGIAESSRYFAERGANETAAALGEADGRRLGRRVRFARVPTGATNCPFCLMLASRGFVYRSELSALNANHPHCHCRIVEGFDGMEVEGYDPDAFYRQWQKLEEIDKREDLSQDEKDVLRLVAADSEQKFNLEQSKELAVKLEEVMSQRKEAFKISGFTKAGYEKTVEAWIKDIGKLYGMDLSGEFLFGSGLHSAMPDGYELWAATRLRNRYQKMQFLGEDSSRRKGNPDLLADGKYIEIKTPLKVKKIEEKIHEGYTQCNNRGGNGGLVILSPLNLEVLDDRYMRYAENTIRRKRRNGQDVSAIVIDENLNLIDLPKK